MEYPRILQLRLFKSGNQHNERLSSRVEQKKRAAWGAFKSIEDVVKKTESSRFVFVFPTPRFFPFKYALETWSLRKQDESSLNVIINAVGRTLLGVSRVTQVRERSEAPAQQSKIKDAVLYAKVSKIRWSGHLMRVNDNR
ncbi:unnamed protein product [Angiostrongylus costaricensis]|uniref:Uncharacterized protein n=1 Tax=Angiostrongylus costaricensis TaxID=334426 RepID=A0A0R3PRR2_ANGCS|nr:unnamed protein product [Angiostrongylus costaricensis]